MSRSRIAIGLVAVASLVSACASGDDTATTLPTPSTSPVQTTVPPAESTAPTTAAVTTTPSATTQPATTQRTTTTTATTTTTVTTTVPAATTTTVTTTIPATSTTSTGSGPPCTSAAFEAGLPYPGLSDPSMIVRFACVGDDATLLAQPPTDAPAFVLLLTWSGTAWEFDRDCHNDVIGVAECLSGLDPAVIDVLALVGETYPRTLDESDPEAWMAECAPSSLRLGDTGVCVAKLQTLLVIDGADLAVDGRFGPATDGHLRALQNAAGLEVDGLAGPATWTALVDAVTRSA